MPDHAHAAFDTFVDHKRRWMLDHWLDERLKTGVAWVEILTELARWLAERRTIEALLVVADAIMHKGARTELDALKVYEGMPEVLAQQIIADCHFAVRRRSII